MSLASTLRNRLHPKLVCFIYYPFPTLWEIPNLMGSDFNSRFTFVDFLFVKSKSLAHPYFMNETYKFNLGCSLRNPNINKLKIPLNEMSSEVIVINKKDLVKKMSHPFWAISTIILVILLIALYFYNPQTSVISEEKAKQIILDFAAKQGATATIISIETDGELYLIVIEIDGQQVPVYLTRDGKNLIPSVIPIGP